MLLEEFDYPLPAELIAQRPLAERDTSRMMVVDRHTGGLQSRRFQELPQILTAGDLVIFNNTKVFPARLLGRRWGTSAQKISKGNPAARKFLSAEIELFLTRQETPDTWQALVRPGRKVRTGEVLVFGEGDLEAEILGRGDYGLRRARLKARKEGIEEAIDRLGHVPLPPYIERPDESSDRDAYQTVYARIRGAVAAPTAGLHFTARVIEELQTRGVETCEITLHVGPGTFRPVHSQRVEDHKMETEQFEISDSAAQAINRALGEGRRIVAVGSTSLRTLEHLAHAYGGRIVSGRGETNLFIYPGFEFRAARALLTNFHLPRSTLLMLVCAIAGKELTLRAYEQAIAERYRFYTYGDCMLIL